MPKTIANKASKAEPNVVTCVDDWDSYFHIIAEAVAIKSKDPKSQVGAVIVSNDNVVLSTGFNGFARDVEDNEDFLADVEEKLKWVCHAEINAVFNAARTGVSLQGAKIYATKFPCLACCNAIIQVGIAHIHTNDDWYWDNDPNDSETHFRKKRTLRQAKIEVHAPFHPDYETGIVPDVLSVLFTSERREANDD